MDWFYHTHLFIPSDYLINTDSINNTRIYSYLFIEMAS